MSDLSAWLAREQRMKAQQQALSGLGAWLVFDLGAGADFAELEKQADLDPEFAGAAVDFVKSKRAVLDRWIELLEAKRKVSQERNGDAAVQHE